MAARSMEVTEARPAQTVLYDHLEKARQDLTDEDLAQNYADTVVFLGNYGVHRGHEGARTLIRLLQKQLPDARFTYRKLQVENGVGFLAWTANASNGNTVRDGADSFVIRDGKIVAQTIYYTVSQR